MKRRIGYAHLGSERIPVFLWDGMLVKSECGRYVAGEQEHGAFGMFKSMDGFEIHLSKHAPDPLRTLLHEYIHAVMFLRGHPIAFADRTEAEWVCDLTSDAMAEMMTRNAALLDIIPNQKGRKR